MAQMRRRQIQAVAAVIIAMIQALSALVIIRRQKRARDLRRQAEEEAPRRVVTRTPHVTRGPRYPSRQGREKYDRPWQSGMVWQEYLHGMTTANPVGEMSPVQLSEFERKFRMPASAFVALADAIEAEYPNRREPAVAVRLKVAACIRWLALGCAWDGLEEGFAVSAKTMSDFFKQKFLPYMQSVYEEHVRTPRTQEQLDAVTDGWEKAGFPGCVGARDGTHVRFWGYNIFHRYAYVGKEGYPCARFDCVVDVDAWPISISRAHEGSHCDINMCRQCEFQAEVDRNPLFTDFEFAVMAKTGEDLAWEKHLLKGVYQIVDGGYQNWRSLVSPWSLPPEGPRLTWNGYLESVRKASERFFGMLKAQWRILYHGISCQRHGDGLEYAERIFKACAVLHVISRRSRDITPSDMSLWRTVDDRELQRMRENCVEATRHMRPNDEDDETLGGDSDDEADDIDPIDPSEANKLEDLRRKLTEHYAWYKETRDAMRVNIRASGPD